MGISRPSASTLQRRMATAAKDLNSPQNDRFDQAVCELVSLAEQLTADSLFLLSHNGTLLTEAALTAASRAMEASLVPSCDQRKAHILRRVADKLSSAVVNNNTGFGAWNRSKIDVTEALFRQLTVSPAGGGLGGAAVMAGLAQKSTDAPLDPHNNDTAQFSPSLISSFKGPGQQDGECPNKRSYLEIFLVAALHEPATHCATGIPSPLLRELNKVVLPELCSRGWKQSLSSDSLTPAALDAFFALCPDAMLSMLRDILTSLSTSLEGHDGPGQPHVKQVIASDTAWSTGVACIAASQALHVAARTVLRSWLAQSGNVAIWYLIVEIYEQSSGLDCCWKGCSGGHTGLGDAHKRKALLASGLPSHLKQLYHPALRRAADELRAVCASSDKTGMASGLHRVLRNLQAAPSEAPRRDSLIVTDRVQGNCFLDLHDEIWGLLLDYPAALRWALQQMRWEELEGQGAVGFGLVRRNEKEVSIAAEWIARLMWPHSEAYQAAVFRVLTETSSSQRGISLLDGTIVSTMKAWRIAWA